MQAYKAAAPRDTLSSRLSQPPLAQTLKHNDGPSSEISYLLGRS